MDRKLCLAILAAASLLAASVRPAQADIVVVAGVNIQDTEAVLLNPATNVLTATGTVGANELLVDFTSSSGSGLLNADPSGQATVSGGFGNVALTQLSFGLANSETFTRAVFNIGAETDGSTLIHVEGINIGGGFFEDDFTIDAGGLNFFTLYAINGQLMTTISLTAINGAVFQGVSQLRLGGLSGTPVPEPASIFLTATGLLGVAVRRCRQRRA